MPADAKKALHTMLESIDHAHFRIDAAIYSFTHKKIARRLAAAARRGVKIRIVFDKESNIRNRKSQIGYLAKYRNIQTMLIAGKPYRRDENDRALMHMKVMVIDNRRVVMGSANWTYSAFGKNYEYLCFTDDYALAKKFERGLATMFGKSLPY